MKDSNGFCCGPRSRMALKGFQAHPHTCCRGQQVTRPIGMTRSQAKAKLFYMFFSFWVTDNPVGIMSRGCLNAWDAFTCDFAPLSMKAVIPNLSPPSFIYQFFFSISFSVEWSLYASIMFNQPAIASPKTLLLIWAESTESSAQLWFSL